jgi:hypothetical protein
MHREEGRKEGKEEEVKKRNEFRARVEQGRVSDRWMEWKESGKSPSFFSLFALSMS